jgi:hypothetical protein
LAAVATGGDAKQGQRKKKNEGREIAEMDPGD